MGSGAKEGERTIGLRRVLLGPQRGIPGQRGLQLGGRGGQRERGSVRRSELTRVEVDPELVVVEREDVRPLQPVASHHQRVHLWAETPSAPSLSRLYNNNAPASS